MIHFYKEIQYKYIHYDTLIKINSYSEHGHLKHGKILNY